MLRLNISSSTDENWLQRVQATYPHLMQNLGSFKVIAYSMTGIVMRSDLIAWIQ